jgi:N utilization substance protein B
LYAIEVGKSASGDIFADIIDDADLDRRTLEFAHALFEQVGDHRQWSDRAITELAHNWKLERIAVIDQIILRMAMTELKVMPDVPVKVVLNEAIELAKQFSTAESSAFINGILDAFVKNLPEASGV